MNAILELTNPEEKPIRERSQKMLLWIAMISMVMVFAALSSAYIVRQADGEWVSVTLPISFYISSAAILLSSLCVALAVKAAKNNRQTMIRSGMAVGLLLGLTFVFFQFEAWSELVEMGVFFTGTNSASGSYIYFLTGLHLAHLFFGIIAMIVSTIKSMGGKYHAGNYHGLVLTATFWHFLDFLWIYLFLFLLIIR